MEILEKILINKEFKQPEKIRSFEIKLYEKSDYQDLMDLYNLVFPGYMSEKLWNWKYMNNPHGKNYTILIKDNVKVISAYSVAKKTFSIIGDLYPCVQSMDTMTNLDYRGLGLSTYLAKLVYEFARIKGNYFVYGFPNKISRYLIFDKLNWEFLGKRNFITKVIPKKIPIKNNNPKYEIKRIEKFDKNYNLFWEKYKKIFSITIEKNVQYLNWRFTNHPFEKYYKYLIFDKGSEEIRAFFVLKKYNEKLGEPYGHIVDFMIGSNSDFEKLDVFKIIENFSLQKFKGDCSLISFWMPENVLRTLALNKLGYFIKEKKKYFGYKILRSTKKLSILKSPNNWYITMANSDVF